MSKKLTIEVDHPGEFWEEMILELKTLRDVVTPKLRAFEDAVHAAFKNKKNKEPQVKGWDEDDDPYRGMYAGDRDGLGVPNGMGCLMFLNFRYMGEFRDGLPHGHGVLDYLLDYFMTNEERNDREGEIIGYSGRFANGLPHGKGLVVINDKEETKMESFHIDGINVGETEIFGHSKNEARRGREAAKKAVFLHLVEPEMEKSEIENFL